MRHSTALAVLLALTALPIGLMGLAHGQDVKELSEKLKAHGGFAAKTEKADLLVVVNGRKFTDKDLSLLAPYKDVTILNLASTAITDDGVKEVVAKLPKLKEFIVRDVPLTNASVKTLSGIGSLERLTLWNAAITDLAMKDIAKLKGLTELDLTNDQAITGKGVKELATLTNLTRLSLITTGMTDEGMPALAKMTNLEELILLNTQVTNVGLKNVAGLKKLKILNLANTRINDAGLASLEGLSELRELDVFGFPNISKTAADALKKKLPKVEIKGVR